jgi:hypothetical protein
MKRRDFLKSTLFFAAISTVVGKVSNVLAADVFVTAGKLGYKDPSPQAKNGKQCSTCKWFKTTGAGVGDCTLPAMKNAMKSPAAPKVKETAYCNMWAKKA